MEITHTSVLLEECLEWLSPENEGYGSNPLLIDSTLGEGGHTFAFLSKYKKLSVIGIDADPVIQQKAKQRLAEFDDRVSFYNGWFDDFYANYPADREKPNLILFDLGISLFHYEKSGRGFSFRYDEPLDMRLSPSATVSAADIVNRTNEKELADLIYMYGEERFSRRIARAIIEARNCEVIENAKNLADIIYRAVPADYRHGPIHPATKTFQALRIAVNGELDRLPRVLESAFSVLKVDGKMGVITFHSLEDRIVKVFFRNLAKNCSCPPEQAICTCGGKKRAEILAKVAPGTEEVKRNSPSRSARLRVVRKLR
ncbi:MAG: 16S rRNA (cytosine(1402)-N(4))-methyltransferase RsmH [Spirochaetaceae bacterium]|nr:16S rRNA (cytosine(1402)-N(4))-methyltransferase RsmH [Spirochaetaceae bacterium]